MTLGCAGKTAHQFTNSDYDKYGLLMNFTDRPGGAADPWYTDDFETTWRDVLAGCKGLLERLQPEN